MKADAQRRYKGNRVVRWSMGAGFTLLELLMVIAIFGIVMGGIYAVFVRSNRVYIAQEELVAAQQEARAALEILGREIRMAGLIASANEATGTDPITTAGYGGSANAKIEVAARDDGAKTTTLAFKADLDGDGATEAVRYIYYHSDHATASRRNTVTRQVKTWSGGGWTNDTGEQLFLENISGLTLNYQLADGTESENPANPDDIRGVEITVVAQTSFAVEPYEGGRSVRQRTLVSNIQIRNMGL